MKIKVNNKCIGCGACQAICPKIFKIVNGKAKALVSETKDDCAKQASDSCPVQAIELK